MNELRKNAELLNGLLKEIPSNPNEIDKMLYQHLYTYLKGAITTYWQINNLHEILKAKSSSK